MKPLVIFEIANNHMGDLAHGKKIVRTYYNLSKKFSHLIEFAVKFQFRDLKSFINPSYLNTDHPQVKRFVDTKLTNAQWNNLINFSKKKFKIICTAFDEKSVELIVKKNFDYLKIAKLFNGRVASVATYCKKSKIKKNYM